MHLNPIQLMFQSLVTQSPGIIVCLIACIVTVLNWQLSPRASMFSLLGFGLMLAVALAGTVVSAMLQSFFLQGGDSGKIHTFGMISGVLGVFWSILRAASYALILAAIYAGRPDPRSTPPKMPSR